MLLLDERGGNRLPNFLLLEIFASSACQALRFIILAGLLLFLHSTWHNLFTSSLRARNRPAFFPFSFHFYLCPPILRLDLFHLFEVFVRNLLLHFFTSKYQMEREVL